MSVATMPFVPANVIDDTSVEWVTPNRALEYLQFNTSNRKPRAAHIKRLAGDMIDGRWVDNGESIKFSQSGRLLDGQHRLMAVAQCGRAVPLRIVRGLPDHCQPTIDDGHKRTGGDVLLMHGVSYSCEIASTVRCLLGYEATGRMLTRPTISNSEILDLYAEYPAIEHSCKIGARACKIFPKSVTPTLAAACHYLFAQINRNQADQFWMDYCEGDGLPKGDPVHTYRSKMGRMSDFRAADRDLPAALAIKAWNARRAGLQILRLNWDAGKEAFPVPR